MTHVYNYDFPLDMEEYVHRVRRMGKTGTSISLWDKAEELINILEVAGQDVPDWLRTPQCGGRPSGERCSLHI